jgi:uncharacterized protein YkwD
VERIRRGTPGTAAHWLAAGGLALLLAAPASASAQPVIEKLRLSGPAKVGKDVDLQAVASDTKAPVSGIVVSFGSRQEEFGISACQPPDSTGALPGGAFALGAHSRFTVPNRFRKPGKRKVLVRMQSGGCTLPLSLTFAQFTVNATKSGRGSQPSKPHVIPAPAKVPLPLPVPPSMALPVSTPLLPPLAVAVQRYYVRAYDARRHARCAYSRRGVGHSSRSLARARRAVLCLLNQQRRRYHLPRLRSNGRLLKAATAHSRSMIRLGYFSHYEPGGLALLARILRTGYLLRTHGWSIGENLGEGIGPGATPSAMVRAWMGSSEHRANILAGKFREIGLGILPGVPGNRRAHGATYTTDFGRRH